MAAVLIFSSQKEREDTSRNAGRKLTLRRHVTSFRLKCKICKNRKLNLCILITVPTFEMCKHQVVPLWSVVFKIKPSKEWNLSLILEFPYKIN